jgi:tetratricopeptide (TPR) repeat protein
LIPAAKGKGCNQVDDIDKLLKDALEAAGKVERPAFKSADYSSIAGVYLQHGQNARCLEVLNLALAAADRIKQPNEKAICLASIAGLYVSAGEITRAKDTFTRAVLLARAAVTPAQQVEALYAAGCEYAGANLREEAEGVLAGLYELVKAPENGLDTACELIDMAGLYFDIGEPDTANRILEEAVAASEAIKDHWFKIERLMGIAEIYAEMDNTTRSVEILNRIEQYLMSLEEIDRTVFLLRMADIHALAGDSPRALETLKIALKSVELNEEAGYQAENLTEIAKKYAVMGHKQSAIELLVRSCQKSAEAADFKDRISILVNNAGLLGQIGEKEQAIGIADQTLGLCRTYPNRKDTLYLLGNLSVVYASLDEKLKVNEIVNEMSEIVAETGAKTTGSGVIAGELSEAGEPEAAIILANLISEFHAKAESLTRIAGSLAGRA